MGRGEAKPVAVEVALQPQDPEARLLWEAFRVRLSAVIAVCNLHWIRAAEGWLYDGRTLTLLVPSRAHADWLSSDLYRGRIERAAEDLNRRGLRVAFIVSPQPATVHDGGL